MIDICNHFSLDDSPEDIHRLHNFVYYSCNTEGFSHFNLHASVCSFQASCPAMGKIFKWFFFFPKNACKQSVADMHKINAGITRNAMD